MSHDPPVCHHRNPPCCRTRVTTSDGKFGEKTKSYDKRKAVNYERRFLVMRQSNYLCKDLLAVLTN